MPAHGWILWPALVLVTALGAWSVGQHLGATRRRILWLASAAMIVPAGYTVLLFEQGGDGWVLIDELWASSFLVVGTMGLGWGIVWGLVASERWEAFAAPVQWIATGVVVAIPISLTILSEGFEMSESNPLFWLLWFLTYPLQAAILGSPLLSSLLPTSLVWPTESHRRAKQIRQAGTASLVVLMVVGSGVGLATTDIEILEEPPRELREPRRALTVWVEIDPGLDPSQGSTADPQPRTKNVTVPFLVAGETSPDETGSVSADLRSDLLLGYDRQEASPTWVSEGLLHVQARDRVDFAATAHRFAEVLYPVAQNLSFARGFATADEANGVHVRLHGSVGPEAGCHWTFDRTLPVYERDQDTGSQTEISIEWTPSDACEAERVRPAAG